MINQELKEKYKKLNQKELNEQFIDACKNDDLEVIKFLLTSPKLKEHADIHASNDEGFRSACAQGHLEVVKYLLTSPELKEHADIHAKDDEGFIWACKNGHLELVKYLLTSAELKEHADVHADNDEGFRWACSDGQLEIVKFLILDMSIEKTKYIKHYLKENQDNKCVKEAIELFKIREFNQKLNNDLEHKERKNKLKI